jgi:hypothetical protein
MAVVHGDASLSPSKPELVAAWLPKQPWATGLGDVEQIGAYRFDDPAGEVGVEALLFRSGDQIVHVPLTYRSAALDGADDFLLGTLEHTALGTRWVYDACADPVAVRAYLSAILTGGEQAPLDVEIGGEIVERRTPSVRVTGSGDSVTAPEGRSVSVQHRGAPAVVAAGGRELVLARLVPDEVTGAETLSAFWDGGEAVVAAVR